MPISLAMATLLGSAGIAGGSMLGASKSASATRYAARVQRNMQKQGLDYLQDVDKMPRQYREGALQLLGNLYGMQQGPEGSVQPGGEEQQYGDGFVGKIQAALAAQRDGDPGGPPLDLSGGSGMVSPYTDREGFMEGLRSDPFYEQLLSEGEDAVARNQNMTGGFRSGSMQQGLASNSQDVLRQLYGQRYGEVQDYESGLRGMANLPSNAPQIAQSFGDMGRTQAQGIVGGEQAMQYGYQNAGNALMQGINAYGNLKRLETGQQGQQSQYNTYPRGTNIGPI